MLKDSIHLFPLNITKNTTKGSKQIIRIFKSKKNCNLGKSRIINMKNSLNLCLELHYYILNHLIYANERG